MIKSGNKQSKKEEKDEIVKVSKFRDTKALKVTSQLYEVDKIRCKLSVHGYRLLYALAQSIDYNQTDLFPEVGFDIKTVFKYMGIENTHRGFEYLNEALENIGENPLKVKERKKNGAFSWSGYAWVTKWHMATDEPLLHIRINEDVKPFLINLKQYALIRPKDYLKLNTDTQNWFYPYLKLKLGSRGSVNLEVTINELKQALFLDKTRSYNPKYNINANTAFFIKVLGISKPKGTYQENKDWCYTKDKDGNFIGTLAMISAHTDINVSAWAKKKGQSYNSIVFTISQKNKEQKRLVEQRHKNEPIKPRSKTKKVTNTKDLFGGIYEEMDKKLLSTALKKEVRIKEFTRQEVEEGAKLFSLGISEYMQRMRIKQRANKTYYQEY